MDGLTRTAKARSFYFDPTYTQPTAVYDHEGRVIVPAGAKVNPLEYMTMSSRMLFFDGRDAGQVKVAQSLIAKYRDGLRVVMTAGRPIEMMRRQKFRIYFDQNGTLVHRFGITHVPSLVAQEGYRMRIDELEVPE